MASDKFKRIAERSRSYRKSIALSLYKFGNGFRSSATFGNLGRQLIVQNLKNAPKEEEEEEEENPHIPIEMHMAGKSLQMELHRHRSTHAAGAPAYNMTIVLVKATNDQMVSLKLHWRRVGGGQCSIFHPVTRHFGDRSDMLQHAEDPFQKKQDYLQNGLYPGVFEPSCFAFVVHFFAFNHTDRDRH
eukprot:598469-Amphidinium_carterae.1